MRAYALAAVQAAASKQATKVADAEALLASAQVRTQTRVAQTDTSRAHRLYTGAPRGQFCAAGLLTGLSCATSLQTDCKKDGRMVKDLTAALESERHKLKQVTDEGLNALQALPGTGACLQTSR